MDNERFAAIRQTILTPAWRKLGKAATDTYIGLALHAERGVGDVWPDAEELAELLGYSVRGIRKGLVELQEAGLIVLKERGRKNRASTYTLLAVPNTVNSGSLNSRSLNDGSLNSGSLEKEQPFTAKGTAVPNTVNSGSPQHIRTEHGTDQDRTAWPAASPPPAEVNHLSTAGTSPASPQEVPQPKASAPKLSRSEILKLAVSSWEHYQAYILFDQAGLLAFDQGGSDALRGLKRGVNFHDHGVPQDEWTTNAHFGWVLIQVGRARDTRELPMILPVDWDRLKKWVKARVADMGGKTFDEAVEFWAEEFDLFDREPSIAFARPEPTAESLMHSEVQKHLAKLRRLSTTELDELRRSLVADSDFFND